MLPKIRSDILIDRTSSGSNGEPLWTIFDPIKNRFFRISDKDHKILQAWWLNDKSKVANYLLQYFNLHIEIKEIETLQQFLISNQLTKTKSISEVEGLTERTKNKRSQRSLNHLISKAFFLRFPLIKPQRLLSVSLPFISFVFKPWLATIIAIIGIIGLILTFRQLSTFSAEITSAFKSSDYHLFIISVLFAKVVHELGHAYTCTYFKCKVAHMGLALMVFWPILYTDTSHASKLKSKKSKMLISAAGVISELYLAAIATFLWLFIPEGDVRTAVILLAAVTWISTLVINLNPLMRFDGYYLLSDLIDVPNLQECSFKLGRWHLRELLFGFNQVAPYNCATLKQKLIIFYAYFTCFYRLFIYLTISLLIYHFVFKALGIGLLLVTLYMFIGKPIINECSYWWKNRNYIRWNVNTIRTTTLLLLFIVLFFMPWKSSTHFPAVMQAENRANLYLHEEARLTSISVQRGQFIEKGEVVMLFESPYLNSELSKANLQIENLKRAIYKSTTNLEMHQDEMVLQSQLLAAIAKKEGLETQLDKLVVKAPFSGVITELSEHISVGLWYSKDALLLKMVDFSSAEVLAFVDEDTEILKIQSLNGMFIPDDLNLPSVPLNKISTATTNVERLNQIILADKFGGNINVYQDENSDYIPVKPVFLWYFQPENNQYITTRQLRGTVKLPVKKISIYEKFKQKAYSVLIRELSF